MGNTSTYNFIEIRIVCKTAFAKCIILKGPNIYQFQELLLSFCRLQLGMIHLTLGQTLRNHLDHFTNRFSQTLVLY